MSGTNRSQALTTGGPRIVLIEPQMAENIGAAARAMLNCGLTNLSLVDPREAWPNEKAVAMSAGAARVLDAVRVHTRIEDAVADLQRVYATSARPRDMIVRTLTPREAAAEIRADAGNDIKTGILFGPERSGLTNDQLTHADTVISIPLNPAYASLNLAQAVLLVGYELSRTDFEDGASPPVDELPLPADKADLESFLARLEAALEERNYFRTKGLRASMARSLRTIFQRTGLSAPEVRTLHGVLTTLIEGWSGRSKGSEDPHD